MAKGGGRPQRRRLSRGFAPAESGNEIVTRDKTNVNDLYDDDDDETISRNSLFGTIIRVDEESPRVREREEMVEAMRQNYYFK